MQQHGFTIMYRKTFTKVGTRREQKDRQSGRETNKMFSQSVVTDFSSVPLGGLGCSYGSRTLGCTTEWMKSSLLARCHCYFATHHTCMYVAQCKQCWGCYKGVSLRVVIENRHIGQLLYFSQQSYILQIIYYNEIYKTHFHQGWISIDNNSLC